MVHQAVILGGVATVTAFASLFMSYKASKQTKIKVRGFVFLLNKLKSKKPDDAALQKLFEPVDKLWAEVLEQERKAFRDDAAADAAKTTLHEMQLKGIWEPGNRFSPFGQTIVYKDIIKNLNRRIAFAKRIQSDLSTKRQQEAGLGSNIIIIAGLPRTGSTMIHRLLSADKTTRTPLWWEQMLDDSSQLPCPPSDLFTDPRAEEVAKGLKGLSLISPNALSELNKFHKIGAYEVEECAPFMRRYFNDMDSAYFSPACVKSRGEWVNDPNVDKSFIFTHLKAWLSLQASTFPEGSDMKWVLKAPLFTPFLNEVSDAFPEATIVFTNRDPMKVVPSTCGLIEVAASLKADWREEDEMWKWIGDYTLDRMQYFASEQMKWTEKQKRHTVINLDYSETLKDPLKTVKNIYSKAGRKFEGTASNSMKAHLEENTQHKHGRADYSLEKFGLSKERVEAGMREYEVKYLGKK
ncbi:hypothetical protein TrLO_g12594 [Triparma laevis f. longispina]|uniref:Sulfotransferase n=1 Tax=Triparma laevis f. longispina TaxID=1714387 RepID=A0A9W7DM06_9STRA|nr:hypothetical protein TrLO_g12594 [Triparma laevis f. longispina]